MTILDNHNHLLINYRAFKAAVSFIKPEVLSDNQEILTKFVESYTNSLPQAEINTPKSFLGGMGVSDRYNCLLFR